MNDTPWQDSSRPWFVEFIRIGMLKLLVLLMSTSLIATPVQADSTVKQSYLPISHPVQVFRGDTHLHTTNSLDVRVLGVTLDTGDAYRFARGDAVVTTTGITARLARPLYFLVVSDYSDAMRGRPNDFGTP